MSVVAAAAPAPAYVVEGRADAWRDGRRTAGLVRLLVRRHLAARYRGSALGFVWSLLNPLLMMAIYTLVFQYILRLSSPGVAYPVFFLSGLLAWSFVHTATINAATSIVDHRALLAAARFPRFALPISAVLANLVNYLVSLPILLVFCLALGVRPGLELLWLPLGVLQLLAVATGLALLVSCITPFFRDLVQILEVLFLGWFFATPVLYPMSLPQTNLPRWALALYELNPVAGAVVLARAPFVGEAIPWLSIAASLPAAIALLLCGWLLFRRLSPHLLDAA